MDNGFIGEIQIIDSDTNWMKSEGFGHKIYETARGLEPFFYDTFLKR